MQRGILLIFFLGTVHVVNAQKLPNKQEKSMWESQVKSNEDIKKWDKPYQAYNSATEIFYSISNDDKKLYLEVKAVKPLIIQKIISQRLTLTLKDITDKKDVKTLALKFPFLNATDRQLVIRNVKSQIFKNLTDSVIINKKRDSIVYLLNNKIQPDANEIMVNDFIHFKDSLMSIYNEIGITATCHFDKSMAYVFQLTIPLKILNIAIDGSNNKISYQIVLNGVEENGISLQPTKDGRGTIRRSSGGMAVAADITPESTILDYPTDFSSAYTLAKKP